MISPASAWRGRWSSWRAVRYQAIIEYVLIGSVALTSFCVVALAYRGFFTAHHQFRQEVFL